MGNRRRAREFAVQMLYQSDLLGCSAAQVLGNFWIGLEAGADERAFAENALNGVSRVKGRLDQLIEEHSTNWKVSRMAPVDRNVLRLAVFELLYMDDIPTSVTLNEAIELGKAFSSDESGAFINGVLDKIARSLPGTKD